MDPIQSIPSLQALALSQFPNDYVPETFLNENSEQFLSSLDSDTKDYVLKHTGEFRTKADIADCIHELHGKH